MKRWLACFAFFSVSCFSQAVEETQFFQERGYLWIRDFFTEAEVSQFREWAKEINDASQQLLSRAERTGESIKELIGHDPTAVIVVPEAANPKQVCRAEDFSACTPDLYTFISERVISYVGKLMKEPYVLFKDKLNFKWPGGGAFLPHQDFPAYDFLGPREHITAMICIDAATIENGCLQVAEDWKKSFAADPTIDSAVLEAGRAVLPYLVGGPSHGSIDPAYSKQITWLPLLTSPRDLVLISSYVPHYSEVNQTSLPRRALFFTLNRFSEGNHRTAYYEAKRNRPDDPIFHIATPTKADNK